MYIIKVNFEIFVGIFKEMKVIFLLTFKIEKKIMKIEFDTLILSAMT